MSRNGKTKNSGPGVETSGFPNYGGFFFINGFFFYNIFWDKVNHNFLIYYLLVISFTRSFLILLVSS